MTTDVAIVRTYVQLASSQQILYCTDTYNEVLDRVEASRQAMLKTDKRAMSNPLSVPLVNVRMIVGIGDGEQAVVDAAFNPMHIVCMYRAHPDV